MMMSPRTLLRAGPQETVAGATLAVQSNIARGMTPAGALGADGSLPSGLAPSEHAAAASASRDAGMSRAIARRVRVEAIVISSRLGFYLRRRFQSGSLMPLWKRQI